jgi:hypothetical protein
VDSAFYCTNCLLHSLQEFEHASYRLERRTSMREAQLQAARRIRRNWILTGMFSLVAAPAMVGLVTEGSDWPEGLTVAAGCAAAIAGCYLVWAALWGIPVAWRWWRGLFAGFSGFIVTSPFGWLVLIAGFFVVPLHGGYLYGVFGGAINEYRKSRELVRTTVP